MEPVILPLDELAMGLMYLLLMAAASFVLILASSIFCIRRLGGRSSSTEVLSPTVVTVSSGDVRGTTTVDSNSRNTLHVVDRTCRKISCLRSVIAGLGLAALFAAGLLVAVEFLGTETLLKWSFKRLQAKTGVAVTFDSATGGPLRGEYVLHRLRAVRANDVHSNFDLLCSSVIVRFSLEDMLFTRFGFDEIRVEQVNGSYEKAGEHGGFAAGSQLSKATRRERDVPVSRLTITDATVKYIDSSVRGDAVKFDLGVKSLECAPFHTAFAAHDIIFRSNVTGTIDQQPFSITSARTDVGTKTEWIAKGLPMNLARSYLTGPFRLLRAGEVDVKVTQEAPDDRMRPVEMDADITLRAIRAGLPDNVKPAVAIAAQLLLTQLKDVPKRMDLEFSLSLDQSKYDLTTTEDMHDVWLQFRSAAVASLLKASGLKVETVSGGVGRELNISVDDLTEKAFQLIDKARERRKAKKAEKAKQPDN